MNRFFRVLVCVAILLLSGGASSWAQTGKITGQVTDAETEEPLPGVNVVIEGTTQGTSTDADGYYTIINVTPGTYAIQATYIGYAQQIVQNLNVNVDLTTTINIEMQEATVGLDEVVVQAQEPVVRADISANVSNLNAEDIENMPVSSLRDMVGLQAGVQGLSVRGGDLSSLSFQVDGSSTHDGRANQPFTGVSFTSIKQVQVQTGGFNAEYGNVRSGLINVVTKDGPRNHYIADAIVRYSPAGKDYFGHPPNAGINGEVPAEEMGYYVRPYMDPAVAFTGTHSDESQWGTYQQQQFPEWEGWNVYAERAMNDENPDNDLSPEQWQQVYQHYHRKSFEITNPDYQIDASFGGPVPGISPYLGNLRFFASYRQTQNAYIIPQNRNSHRDYLGRLRLTSDIASGMKLELQGMVNREYAHNATNNGRPSYFTGRRGSFNMVDRMYKHVTGYEFFLFANDGWSLQDVKRNMGGVKLTHTVNANTFYEVQLNRMDSYYYAYKDRFRDDSTIVKTIGTLGLTESPFGMSMSPSNRTPTKMALGGYWSSAEDSSWAKRWDGSFDITSQVNRRNQVKFGADFIYTHHRRDNEQTTTGSPAILHDWQRNTSQGAVYAQNKLEFEGLVANVGLRLDYFKAVGGWYDYALFDTSFAATAQGIPLEELIAQEPIEAQVALSPRIGVSFPITARSKLFFNYGHFREMLEPNNIFRIDRIGSVGSIGNPNHPMPRTVAYELGYEHNLFNQFLLRLTGYYKDLAEQPRNVRFAGAGGNVNYRTSLPYNYEDIRGFEVSLNKIVGLVRGWVNYTYMARKGGNYGFGTYFESVVDRRDYMRDYRNREYTPVPRPFARANISLIAPQEFGPSISGMHPLADWRLSFIGTWRSGNAFTWCGGGGSCPGGISNNVRWKDHYNLDTRLSKVFDSQAGQIMVFADINNMLNLRRLNSGAFMAVDDDRNRYMKSLHLAKNTFEDLDPPPYRFIPGSDRPGDFRKPGVEFVPIDIISGTDANGNPDVDNPSEQALYYFAPDNIKDGVYYQSVNGEWQKADQAKVDQVLKDQAYIDMPNLRAFRFLDPREVWLGVRYTF